MRISHWVSDVGTSDLNQIAKRTDIALLLPRKPVGAQRVEIARKQFVRCHFLAQFGFQPVPDAGRRRYRNLLPDNGAQQRAIAARPDPFFGIAHPIERLRNAVIPSGERIEAAAQYSIAQSHRISLACKLSCDRLAAATNAGYAALSGAAQEGKPERCQS